MARKPENNSMQNTVSESLPGEDVSKEVTSKPVRALTSKDLQKLNLSQSRRAIAQLEFTVASKEHQLKGLLLQINELQHKLIAVDTQNALNSAQAARERMTIIGKGHNKIIEEICQNYEGLVPGKFAYDEDTGELSDLPGEGKTA
jgi:hypothetical protein